MGASDMGAVDKVFGVEREENFVNPNVIDFTNGEGYSIAHADSFEAIKCIGDETVDFTIFSPPFASLYTYSDSERDAGNCLNMRQFIKHFRYLCPELLRITRAGRLCAIHCMELPTSKARDGIIGLQDFRGWLSRAMQSKGWIYHGEVCIWKDPVTQMQRTHALGLLHKTVKGNATMCRPGLADYVMLFRKPGDCVEKVKHTAEEFPVEQWQKWASPVWLDIDPSDTLQHRSARGFEDERHICPLQLEVIRRGVILYTNPGDVVFTPFLGIGSELFVALGGTTKAGLSCAPRRGLGIELKREYFEQASRNLQIARSKQLTLEMTESVNV
jgi:hypothetical protein